MRKTKTQELVEKAKEAGCYREIEVIGRNKALAEKGDVCTTGRVVTIRLNAAGQIKER